MSRRTSKYKMEGKTRTLSYILEIATKCELSEWKGSVTYGLGADISLLHCLETGIWNLAHKSDHRAEIFGEHRSARRSGTASRGTALLVLSLRMRSFPKTEFDSICVGKSIRLFSIKYTAFTRPRLFNIWIRLSICWLALFLRCLPFWRSYY